MFSKSIAGVDIGGTKIEVALADIDGRTISLTRFPTDIKIGPRRILDSIVTEIKKMAEESATELIAVGAGCGGPLNRQHGLNLSPPNLPGWDEFPVTKLLEEQHGVPALLDNDANAGALGEFEYGAGRGLSNIVYMTISTGIGGGLIIAGELTHGVRDGAGEVGHITVLPDGPPCGCGGRGCLEALRSGTGIARRARERLLDGAPSSMTSLQPTEVTAKLVAEAARNGDPLACEIWGGTIYYLAIGIGNIVNMLAPEAVILGGGVSTAGEQLLRPLRRQV